MDLFSLTASKRTTRYLKNLVMYELVDVNRLNALKMSNLLQSEWEYDDDEYVNKTTQHDNEIQQISRYILNNKKNFGIEVKYQFGGTTRDDYGRTYPFKSLGLSTIRKKIRETLCHDVYYDFDIINAQPSIMLQLTEKNQISNNNLRQYCENRDEILNTLSEHYEVDRTAIKELFIRMLFGGGFKNWAIENNIEDAIPTDFISNFGNEIKLLINIICENNKKNGEIYAVRKKKISNNLEASVFGIFNQHLETSIVARIIERIVEDTNLMKHPKNKDFITGCYEYDGIRLLMSNVDYFKYDGEMGVNAVIKYLDKTTLEETGYDLKWINKPYGEIYDINSGLSDLNELDCELKNDKDMIKKMRLEVHSGVVDMINEQYKDFYAYSREDNTFFCWDEVKNRYVNSFTPLYNKIDTLVLPRVYAILDKYNDMPNKTTDMFSLITDTESIVKNFNNEPFRKCVIQMAKTKSEIDCFQRDFKIFLLGFDNGVLDMENKVFREYDPTDRITMTCGYDFDVAYLPNDYINKIPSITSIDTKEEVIQKKNKIYELVSSIQPVEDERDYFYKIHATALTGKAIERAFILNGKGRNGKGVFSALMCNMLGEYACSSLRQSIITNKDKSSSNSATEGLSALKNARYVAMKEPPKNSKIQNSILKLLTGGDKIPYRPLYHTESKLEPTWTLFLECNVKLYFEETPTNAEFERIRDLYFPNKFVSSEDKVDEANGYYLGDNTLKDASFQIEHRHALLNILLGYLNELFEDNFNVDKKMPKNVKSRTDAYLRESNVILEIIRKHYVIDLTAEPIKHKDIWNTIQLSKHYINLFRNEKKEITSVSVKNLLKSDDFFKDARVDDRRNHIQKYRLRQIYDDDDSDDDDDDDE